MNVRSEYLTTDVVNSYEHVRFSGILGRHRWRVEQLGVRKALAHIGHADSVLDVPTGIGRWLPVIEESVPCRSLMAADVSPAMIDRARGESDNRVAFVMADALALPYADKSFDLVFCHALSKHLPLEVQEELLLELARVSRAYVICSFGLLSGLSGLIRRLRRASGAVAVGPRWLEAASTKAGLSIIAAPRCTTILGVERSVVFRALDD